MMNILFRQIPTQLLVWCQALAIMVLFNGFLLGAATAQNPATHTWGQLSSQYQELMAKRNYSEALAVALKALEAAEQAFGPDHDNTVASLVELSRVYIATNDNSKAESNFLRAYNITEKKWGPKSAQMGLLATRIGNWYAGWKQFSKAEPFLLTAIAVSDQIHGVEALNTRAAVLDLAQLYRSLPDLKKAETLYLRALAITEKVQGPEHGNMGTRFNELGGLYTDMKDFAQAVAFYQKAVLLFEKISGVDHPFTITVLNNLARVKRQSGAVTDAENIYLRVLTSSERTKGKDHPDTEILLANLANFYTELGRPSEAEPLRVRLLLSAKAKHAVPHIQVVQRLRQLGILYRELDQPLKAREQFEEAAKILEQLYGEQHVVVASNLTDLGNTYLETADFTQAATLFSRALTMSQRLQGVDHIDYATYAASLATAYRELGRNAEAETLFLKSLSIAEKSLGSEVPLVGTLAGRLGNLYLDLGQSARAEPLFIRSLKIAEKNYGVDSRATLPNVIDLSKFYFKTSRYDLARPFFLRALDTAQRAHGPIHTATGTAANNLAEFYANTSAFAQAEPLFKRAIEINERVRGPQHMAVAYNLGNLASMYFTMGQFVKAEPLFLRALAIYEKTYGVEHENVGIALSNLGVSYTESKQFQKAEPILQRALALTERALGANHPLTTIRLNNLGALYLDMGRFKEAEALYLRALAITQNTQGPNHLDTAGRLNNLATLYLADQSIERTEKIAAHYWDVFSIGVLRGDQRLQWVVTSNLMSTYESDRNRIKDSTISELAIVMGKFSVNALQKVRETILGMDLASQNNFMRSNQGTYQNLANLLIEKGRIEEAEQVLSMLKQKEFNDLGDGFSQSSASGPDRSTIAYVGVEATLIAQLNALVQRSATLEKTQGQSSAMSSTDNAIALWKKEFIELPRLFKDAFAQAQAGRPEAASALANRSRLQSKVEADRAGAVGLHYSVGNTRTGIIVATPNGSFGRFTNVGKERLAQLVAQMRKAIVDRTDVRPIAQQLYQLLIAPVEADLNRSGAKTLVLSLDQSLRYLPFAALQDSQGQYLIEQFALTNWSQVADVTPQQNFKLWQISALGVTQEKLGFSALPGVKAEVESIVKTNKTPNGILPGVIALDQQFNRAQLEQAIKGTNGSVHNVVHIASHFDFRPGNESASVLLLGEGEPLSLGQLARLDYGRIEQLTLSACETANGGGLNENGAEVEGLAASVLKNRAQSVLATLWKISDASTPKIMQAFYVQRSQSAPLSRAQALRQAQLMMIRGAISAPTDDTTRALQRLQTNPPSPATPRSVVDPARPYAHPYFWAAFTLSGNWL